MKKRKETQKQRARREEREFQASLKGMTKEEIIAANKARVAKYHPEPDMSRSSTVIQRERRKIEFEKSKKHIWMSIVSVPMGGINKK